MKRRRKKKKNALNLHVNTDHLKEHHRVDVEESGCQGEWAA